MTEISMNYMHVQEWVEVENKKNNDSLPCYPVNRYCLSRELWIEEEKEEEERNKQKSTNRTQTKLNAPHVR